MVTAQPRYKQVYFMKILRSTLFASFQLAIGIFQMKILVFSSIFNLKFLGWLRYTVWVVLPYFSYDFLIKATIKELRRWTSWLEQVLGQNTSTLLSLYFSMTMNRWKNRNFREKSESYMIIVLLGSMQWASVSKLNRSSRVNSQQNIWKCISLRHICCNKLGL